MCACHSALARATTVRQHRATVCASLYGTCRARGLPLLTSNRSRLFVRTRSYRSFNDFYGNSLERNSVCYHSDDASVVVMVTDLWWVRVGVG